MYFATYRTENIYWFLLLRNGLSTKATTKGDTGTGTWNWKWNRALFMQIIALNHRTRRNISNPTMRTGLLSGLDFKSAQSDIIRSEAENWIKMRGLEI